MNSLIRCHQVLEDTVGHLEALLKGPGCNKVPFRIESEDDVITASATSLSEKAVPILVVSSVTGRGLNLLTKFLHLLPPGLGAAEREKLEQEPVEFQIYETFCLPQVGTVLGGLLTQVSSFGPANNCLSRLIDSHSSVELMN